MGKRKNPAARELARRRWNKLNAEQRSEQNKAAAGVRYAGTTRAERSQLMRDLVGRRWAKSRTRTTTKRRTMA